MGPICLSVTDIALLLPSKFCQKAVAAAGAKVVAILRIFYACWGWRHNIEATANEDDDDDDRPTPDSGRLCVGDCLWVPAPTSSSKCWSSGHKTKKTTRVSCFVFFALELYHINGHCVRQLWCFGKSFEVWGFRRSYCTSYSESEYKSQSVPESRSPRASNYCLTLTGEECQEEGKKQHFKCHSCRATWKSTQAF